MKAMVEENAQSEKLEKTHQDTQEKVVEMMEMIRTLIKEKGLVEGSNP